MSLPSKQYLSRYRQDVVRLLKKISDEAMSCASSERLLKATPGEVYRRCGKPTCKCAGADGERHGPYKVIQVYRNGRQKQVSLKKSEEELWHLAKSYQAQMEKLSRVKALHSQLCELISELIEDKLVDLDK